MRDHKVARNIWRTTSGWRVSVSGFDPATGTSRPLRKRFPPSWTVDELEEYRDTVQLETARLRRQWRDAPRPAIPDPTFTEDARRYLALDVVRTMPSYTTRAIEMEKWITIFGDRVRRTITPVEIDAALQRLLSDGYSGSTVNKFRTALMSLWTRLDGRSAANPVRDTQVFDEAALTPRGQPYELLQRILALIPEQGVVDRATIYEEVWQEPMTALAPRYGVSDSFLHRVCRHLAVPTPPRGYWRQPATARTARPPLPPTTTPLRTRVPEAAKHRARLEVLLWTGMDPSQLARMGPEHVSFEKMHYSTPLRRKGSRRRSAPRAVFPKPLAPDAARAFHRLDELHCWGPFDPHVLRRAWYTAIATLETQLRVEYADPTVTLPRIRLKDIRHSFATALYEQTKSLETVRQMIDHAPNSPLTIRYTLGAVPSVLRAQVSQFPRRVALPPRGRSRQTPPDSFPPAATRRTARPRQ